MNQQRNNEFNTEIKKNITVPSPLKTICARVKSRYVETDHPTLRKESL